MADYIEASTGRITLGKSRTGPYEAGVGENERNPTRHKARKRERTLARDFPHCVEIIAPLGGFIRTPSRPNRSSAATGKVPTKRVFEGVFSSLEK
jgi:hypothetical protein